MGNDDLRRIADKQEEMNLTLARLTKSVEHHVRRTDALEALVMRLKGEVAPIKAYVERARGIMWAVSVGVAALLAARSLGLI